MRSIKVASFQCFSVLTLSLAVVACGGGASDDGVSDGQKTFKASGGVVQKGPLIKGGVVTAQEMSDILAPTGKQYTYNIDSDLGTFNPTSNFSSKYLELNATGYYYDEATNEISDGVLALSSFSDLSVDSDININLLTTLAHKRIKNLINNSGMKFDEARRKAEKEVLAVFNIRNTESFGSFSSLDISKGRDSDYALATISSIFVLGNKSGVLASNIADFQSDIADNGVVDDVAIINKIQSTARKLDAAKIAQNLTQKYQALGKNYTENGIKSWLDADGDGVVGKFEYSTNNAEPSKMYSANIYVVEAADNGKAFSTSAGELLVNGVKVTGSTAKVKTGDILSISLLSGSQSNDSIVAYLDSENKHVAKFTLITKPINLSVVASINNVGVASSVALSADNNTIFISSIDSCSYNNNCSNPSNNGGLYLLNVTDVLNPKQLSLAQYPTNGYRWAGYNSVAMSVDGKNAYVANGQQELQVFDVSILTSLNMLSRTSTTCQALSVLPSLNSKNVFVGTSCNNIIQFNVTDGVKPTISKIIDTKTQPQNELTISPDEKLLAFRSQVFDISSGLPTLDISSIVSNPLAIAFIENKKALVVNPNTLTTIDLDKPQETTSQIPLSFSNSGSCCSAPVSLKYIASRRIAYLVYGGELKVIDMADITHPVVRGSIILPEPSNGYNNSHTGVVVSSDGAIIYAIYKGSVIVIRT